MSSGPGPDAADVRREAQEAIERARQEVSEAEQSLSENPEDTEGLITGSAEVLVSPPVTAALRARLEEGLRRITGLRLVSSGGTGAGEIRMIVFAAQPLPLADLVKKWPFVAEVASRQVKRVTQLQVRLAAPE